MLAAVTALNHDGLVVFNVIVTDGHVPLYAFTVKSPKTTPAELVQAVPVPVNPPVAVMALGVKPFAMQLAYAKDTPDAAAPNAPCAAAI